MSDSTSNLYGFIISLGKTDRTVTFSLSFTTALTVMQSQASYSTSGTGWTTLTFNNPIYLWDMGAGAYLFSGVISTADTSIVGSSYITSALDTPIEIDLVGASGNRFGIYHSAQIAAGQTTLDFNWSLSGVPPIAPSQVASFLQWSVSNFPWVP